ncbi:MAG: DUF4386 domain-containing protein [Chitinophagales bacterium]|nr:DUF4386 domain-containing protein [Chitinophagales bacterium]
MFKNTNQKRMAGVFLILVVVSILASLTIAVKYGITLNANELEQTLHNVAHNIGAHILELIFDVLSSVFLIIFAVLFYGILRRDTVALIVSTFFIISGVIMIIHNMGNFAVTWIAKEFVQAGNTEVYALKASAYATLLTAKWGVTLASVFLIIGIFICAYHIIKDSKFIGWFGVLSGSLGIPAIMLVWYGTHFEMISYLLWLPVLVWKVILGIWLIKLQIT